MRRFNVYRHGIQLGFGVRFADGSSAFNRDTGDVETLKPEYWDVFVGMAESVDFELEWID